jgi:branched-chain amino acid transport system permease protein
MTAILAATERPREVLKGVLGQRFAGPFIKFGLAALVLVVFVRVAFKPPIGTYLNGFAVGSLYGLLGAGVILVYRTNRVINFAAAGIGAVPGVLMVLLVVKKGLPWPIAFVGCIVLAAILGAAIDVLVIRRFAKAPRLILTVATIGVSQILAGISFFIPIWLGTEGRPVSDIPTPFKRFRFDLGNEIFNGDYPFAIFAVVVAVTGLALFFRYTRIGIALRASAENADRASLLGIPVRRVGTVAWILAAVLGALCIFLRSSLVGVPIDGSLGIVVLLYALAAAVIARMESIPVCLGAGIAIGILDQASVFKAGSNSLAGAVMLVLILGALLLQRGKLSRAQDSGVSSFSMVKEFRGVPAELRNVREVQLGRAALAVIVGGAFLVAPILVSDADIGKITAILIYAMVAISLVILTGWAGQISLGQFGIVGFGAMIGGGLAANQNVDFFVALFAGTLAGATVAVLVGIPALRVQGLFLAVTTLAFGVAVQGFFLSPEYFVGKALLPESGARIERPMLWQRIDLNDGRNYYYFCLVFLALVLLMARSYRRNRAGRILIAVRDNQRAAPSYAINLARTRLAAFAISGAVAASAGVLLAYQQGAIDRSTYGFGNSIEVFIMAVVGGLTSLPGAVLGAVVIKGASYFGSATVQLLATGAGLLIVLSVIPGGFAEVLYGLRDKFLLWVANRHGILVPSLVADRRVVATGEDETDVITDAEHHVEEQESFDLSSRPSITCPVCGEILTIEAAPSHEHLRTDERELVAVTAGGASGTTPVDEVTTDGGGKRRLARAREGRR